MSVVTDTFANRAAGMSTGISRSNTPSASAISLFRVARNGLSTPNPQPFSGPYSSVSGAGETVQFGSWSTYAQTFGFVAEPNHRKQTPRAQAPCVHNAMTARPNHAPHSLRKALLTPSRVAGSASSRQRVHARPWSRQLGWQGQLVHASVFTHGLGHASSGGRALRISPSSPPACRPAWTPSCAWSALSAASASSMRCKK